MPGTSLNHTLIHSDAIDDLADVDGVFIGKIGSAAVFYMLYCSILRKCRFITPFWT